jgi:hypothetical protein
LVVGREEVDMKKPSLWKVHSISKVGLKLIVSLHSKLPEVGKWIQIESNISWVIKTRLSPLPTQKGYASILSLTSKLTPLTFPHSEQSFLFVPIDTWNNSKKASLSGVVPTQVSLRNDVLLQLSIFLKIYLGANQNRPPSLPSKDFSTIVNLSLLVLPEKPTRQLPSLFHTSVPLVLFIYLYSFSHPIYILCLCC